MSSTERWQAEAEAEGQRLDRYLASRFGVARNQVQQWIRAGLVEIDGRKAKASSLLAGGDQLSCRPPEPAVETRVTPEEGELRILHEDSELVVLDKPAGLTVHPGAGRSTGTLVHRLLGRYPETGGVGGPGRPGIVHRLDKDTTGVMVIARTPRSYSALSEAFSSRRVGKRYLAVVHGRPAEPEGCIELPVGRHPTRRKEMAVVTGGRPARTEYRLVASCGAVSLLEIDLATGRTHQIRVHLKSVKLPLVGDPVYGEARWKTAPPAMRAALREFPRPALHAWRLTLPHPATGEIARFEAPPPVDLQQLWSEVSEAELPPLPAWS